AGLEQIDRNGRVLIDPIAAPEQLQTTLRGYQREGLAWLNLLDDLEFGGCLADDMGLGKTVQIIAFILLQRVRRKEASQREERAGTDDDAGPDTGLKTNLPVVPTSLIFNWQQEIEKFAPDLKFVVHHG